MDNAKIYFLDEDVFSKISEILEKNGIEENLMDAFLKEDTSFLDIVLDLTESFAKEEITEKDMVLSLESQLKISQQAAQNIFNDIKSKILPVTKKMTGEVQAQPATPLPPLKMAKEILDQNVRDKKIKDIQKPTKTIKKEANSPKKPDTYREPIE